MNFSNAYILGVQRRSDYFGERTANYRTVDTISVEGYIDLRASNTDYKGVRQAISVIDSNLSLEPLCPYFVFISNKTSLSPDL